MNRLILERHTGVRNKSVYATIMMVFLTGCSFLDIDPPRTQLVSESVFESEESADAAVIGIYSRMMEYQGMFSLLTTSTTGLTSDELINVSGEPDNQQFYENALLPSNNTIQILWQNGYEVIYGANAVIEGLNGSMITPALRDQLEGEARFIRAFAHFYLVNMFGDIPWVATTDVHKNAAVSRDNMATVYEAIVGDLQMARQQLPVFSGDKTRPTQDAATALLARTYLYTGQWNLAEQAASEIIDNANYSLVDINDVFLGGSDEAIWQLQPVSPGYNTYEGDVFVPVTLPTSFELNPTLVSALDLSDKRMAWIGNAVEGITDHFYPFKYKLRHGAPDVLEYYTVFRLAEAYLIRAEARVMLDKFSEAIADVDVIKLRAGIPLLSATDPSASADEIRAAIAAERRVELVAEWGHRWFDLKRTGKINDVLATKPGWQSTDSNFPIPQVELLRNSNMTQNEGYQ